MKNRNDILVKNKKANHEYLLIDFYEAGIVLYGTEIKSIRLGKVNLNDSYCSFKDNELFVIGMHISEYDNASFKSHEPKRDRKLLLNSRELNKLGKQVKEKGLTIIPTNLHFNKGLAKLEIALAKGKHIYDKKEAIKERDIKRDLENTLKY